MVNKCSAGKENVPLALAAMHETTITALRSYFPNRRDIANFKKYLTFSVLFRTLRKDTGNILEHILENLLEMLRSMGRKKLCFYNSGKLD